MPTSFKSPLTLYVLWHPDYADGALLANKLFSVFSRNVNDPFVRTPGIPVYFRSCPAARDTKVPRPIPFEESAHTAIVILVDDHMVVNDQWNAYVAGLNKTAADFEGKARLFPVAVNSNSFSFPIANTNFIRLFEVPEKPSTSPRGDAVPQSGEKEQPSGHDGGLTINIFINSEQAESIRVEQAVVKTEPPVVAAKDTAPQSTDGGQDSPVAAADPTLFDRQAAFLIGKLVHELSRLLYHQPRVTERDVVQSAPPVRMFISHAKADGAAIAAAIRNQIHSDTALNSFFDANDIAVGYQFSAELLAALEESAVICVQTDYYATREWCLWEVINAKRLDRPVVVVNAVADREPRSFPYIGNVPTIRWRFDHQDDREQIQQVLDMTLFEVLGTRFRELLQKLLIKTFGLPDNTGVLGHPPELFSVLKITSDGNQQGHTREKPRYVVYPDPPLGDEELRLLEEMAPSIRFVTPMMLPLVQHQIDRNCK